ncbi:MAG: autotransporter domain-containing protein, partial [Alphaproteobacteria bacterium]|nr:autotransporter domain-containing protein [Alphaproteobacteria bacterium]
LMSSELLASYFGLSALPANQAGGTNFATGGARDSLPSGGGSAAVPTATQVANYLALSGGRANPNALYLIGSGGNDLIAISGLSLAQQNAAATAAANSLVAAIQSLSAAGARFIILPDQMFGPPAQQSVRLLYDSTLWSGLAASGVSFIPADVNAVFRAIQQNPAAFGVTLGVGTVGVNTPSACVAPAGVTTAWGVMCAPVATASGTATLATPNAEQTRLFADDLHLSAAGQQIIADYYRNLLLAPMQMSLLAETPLKTRAGVIAAIENQIPLSQRMRGPLGFNAWLTGDLTGIRVNTTPGIAGESTMPAALTAGVDYKPFDGLLFGVALSGSRQNAAFDFGGGFRQDEFAVSLYAAAVRGPWWGDLIGSYGHLAYDINRSVPIGITLQSNVASTGGHNIAFAAEGGYDFIAGAFKHGPVVGVTLQQVRVDGFTESGSFTSLAFGDQVRNSALSAFGYRAELDAGQFRPFAKAVWNHEFAAADRLVTASLTTIAAPSYALPALQLGRDWGTGTIGVAATLGPRATGLVSLIGQVGQNGATSFGGQAGINVAF